MAENSPADTEPKPRGGRRFQPGQSGNPAGKPAGARASIYAALDAAAAEALPDIIPKLVELAKQGDTRAAELLMRRAWPERKGRPVAFAIPSLAGAAGLAAAMGAVTEAMASGALSPEEASGVAAVLDIHRKTIALEDHEERLQALEGGRG